MIGLNLAYIYQSSEKFDALRALKPDTELKEIWIDLLIAQGNLRDIYSGEVFAHAFRTSRNTASYIYNIIEGLLTRHREDPESLLTEHDVQNIQSGLSEVETILRAELSAADAYLATPIGAYDSAALLQEPWRVWPTDLLTKLPDTRSDVDELGKCMAFQLATAAGFHTLRIVETVLRKYWEVVSKNSAHPKAKTIGSYVVALEKKEIGDPKVIAALKQLKDLHRNPLMHPEASLTVEEAITLLGISFSVVTPMLNAVPTPPVDQDSEESAEE